MYNSLIPKKFRSKSISSEREVAAAAGISRGALRSILATGSGVRISSLNALAKYLGLQLSIIAAPTRDVQADYSTIGTGYKVLRDGFDSWKIHFMDMVDEFRRASDPRLILLPPPRALDPKLHSLMASIVYALSNEVEMQPPEWAERIYFLEQAWFPSKSESLKAMNILESPLSFRRNNIFVGANFLDRA